MDFLLKPWPWYISGIIIGLIAPIMLLLGNKPFGISSTLRQICAACIPKKIPLFNYNWKKDSWNLFFATGILIGSFIATQFLSNHDSIVISKNTLNYLNQHKITQTHALLPTEIFSWESLFTTRGFICIVIGGFLVGFGTRYAGGCTSGHSIFGLSNLQVPSLIATISFMVGGILITWFVLPFILNL